MPRGGETSGVEDMPRGGETSGVTLKGDGVPGSDRWRRGGYGNSLAIQETKGGGNNSRGEEMTSVQEPAAP